MHKYKKHVTISLWTLCTASFISLLFSNEINMNTSVNKLKSEKVEVMPWQIILFQMQIYIFFSQYLWNGNMQKSKSFWKTSVCIYYFSFNQWYSFSFCRIDCIKGCKIGGGYLGRKFTWEDQIWPPGIKPEKTFANR